MILCTLKGIPEKKNDLKKLCVPTLPNDGLTLYTGWVVGPNLGPNYLQWLSEETTSS